MHCKPHRAPDPHMGWGTETGIWDKRRDKNSVLFREPPAFLKLILQHAFLLPRGPSTSSAQWLSVHSMAKGFSDPSGNWRSKDSTPNHVYPSRYCRTQPTNGSHTCCWPDFAGAWNLIGDLPKVQQVNTSQSPVFSIQFSPSPWFTRPRSYTWQSSTTQGMVCILA